MRRTSWTSSNDLKISISELHENSYFFTFFILFPYKRLTGLEILPTQFCISKHTLSNYLIGFLASDSHLRPNGIKSWKNMLNYIVTFEISRTSFFSMKESASHHIICFCAAARRKHRKTCPEAPEYHQIILKYQFMNFMKTHVFFSFSHPLFL